MTIDEKRIAVHQYCDATFLKSRCDGCKLIGEWEHSLNHGCVKHDSHGTACLRISRASEEELDKALELIKVNAVDHPNHYNQGDIECIDAMVAAYGKESVQIFCLLNAFKYIWRAEHKNGKEDLEKAIWYLKKNKELSEQ